MKTLLYALFLFVFSASLSAQQGWYAINTGSGVNITDISFTDPQNGLILYNGQSCFTTTNGGVTFAQQNLVTFWYEELRKAFLLTPAEGYVSGDTRGGGWTFPLGFKTTNMGSNWASANIFGSVQDIENFSNTMYLSRGHALDFTVTGDFARYNKATSQIQILMHDDEIFYESSFINENTGWVYSLFTMDTPPRIKKLHKTTNGGANFSLVFADTAQMFGIHFKDIKFFNQTDGIAISNDTLKYTTNGGINWNGYNSALTQGVKAAHFINPGTGWIASLGFIHRTIDGGVSWQMQASAPNVRKIQMLDSLNGYAIAFNSIMYKTVTGGVVSASGTGTEIVSEYKLFQNYPNPFNPSTVIKYNLPVSSHVLLSIYDASGRLLKELINTSQSPGFHEITFDGSSFSSGIYYYTLKAGEYKETKKMALLR